MTVENDKLRILLVDDVEANLVALVAQLSDLSCELVCAPNGNEALRRLLKDEFALILLDVQMPEMDGFEVARYARDNPLTRDVPIIFVTAMNPSESSSFRGYGAGAVDLLHKPIDPYILRSKVQVFLDLYDARRRLRRQNEELARAGRAKSDFLATMSHELRTPLNSIIGFSEVLIDGKFGELNDRQGRCVRNVHTSGRHLLTLINDLLDLSKVEADRLDIELRACSAAQVLLEAQAAMQPVADAAKVALVVAPAGADSSTVMADALRLKQVLLNLVSNAIKFTPPGGQVTVRVEPDAAGVRLSVADTGPGISEEDVGRLFAPFSQLANAKGKGGTGLGLALSKRLVELMGGRLGVTSSVGSGSTFFVELKRPA